MNKRLAVFFFIVVFIISGCSNTEKNKEMSNIESVEISYYKPDSVKPQPELVLMLSELKDIENTRTWLNNINHTSLQLPSNIKSLFLIQVSYRPKDQLETKQIAYAKDTNDQVFVKLLSENTEFNVDEFNTNVFKELLQNFELNDWHSTDPLSFIAS